MCFFLTLNLARPFFSINRPDVQFDGLYLVVITVVTIMYLTVALLIGIFTHVLRFLMTGPMWSAELDVGCYKNCGVVHVRVIEIV
jgi:hypothetical protein